MGRSTVHEATSKTMLPEFGQVGFAFSSCGQPVPTATDFRHNLFDYVQVTIRAEGKVSLEEAVETGPLAGLTGYYYREEVGTVVIEVGPYSYEPLMMSEPLLFRWDSLRPWTATNKPMLPVETRRSLNIGSKHQQLALGRFLEGASLLADVQRILAILENETLCIYTLVHEKGNETRRKVYRLEQEILQVYGDADLFFRVINLQEFPSRAWNELVPSEATIAYEKTTWRTDAGYQFTLATGR